MNTATFIDPPCDTDRASRAWRCARRVGVVVCKVRQIDGTIRLQRVPCDVRVRSPRRDCKVIRAEHA